LEYWIKVLTAYVIVVLRKYRKHSLSVSLFLGLALYFEQELRWIQDICICCVTDIIKSL